MVSLVSYKHRLKHTKSLISPHFTSSIDFRERKEVLTTCIRCESNIKVDPDLACLGVTENSSSMPPVLGHPVPALNLILSHFEFTFSGRTLCFCQNTIASAGARAPT